MYGTYARQHQSNTHAIDPDTGVVFLNQFPKYGVGCFNIDRCTEKNSIRTNFVQRNTNKIVYPCHLSVRRHFFSMFTLKSDNGLIFIVYLFQIDENRDLWIIINNAPRFFYATLNETEINFRVWKISVDDAIRQGKCLDS